LGWGYGTSLALPKGWEKKTEEAPVVRLGERGLLAAVCEKKIKNDQKRGRICFIKLYHCVAYHQWKRVLSGITAAKAAREGLLGFRRRRRVQEENAVV